MSFWRFSFWSLIIQLIFANSLLAANLHGLVQNEKGEPLPFASVYIQGTSIGTTTNMDGRYHLELKPGEYAVVFQYVGYQQKLLQVVMTTQSQNIDVQLFPIDVQMQEVVVVAGEDPAYEIIRNAIRMRKYYQNQVENYQCDAYVKGVQRVQDLPEKIMGRSLGQFRQGLDSTGSGIVYLSESVSKLYFKKPAFREEMVSSKVSGNDNGFSFNSGVGMTEFSFYENQLDLNETKLLSPIANTAIAAYKYELITSFADAGKWVHKIKVIPRNKLGALFHGYIYIVDGLWCIHSTELRTTGKSANISMLDTVEFKQLHLPVQDSIWRLFSQEIEFNMNVFGIGILGRFVGVFHNYEIEPTYDKKFFGPEIFKVGEEANKKDIQYWDSIRPIPLTPEEAKEYRTKDSLQVIWNSKEYKDSLDRIGNKPGFGILLSGYRYSKRYKGWNIVVPSPISNLQFNTVQGLYGHLAVTFNKRFDEDWMNWVKLHGELQYGFSDKKLRGMLRFERKFNDIDDARLIVEGGRKTTQFNQAEPIIPLVNTLYSLLLRKNFLKLYDQTYAEVQYMQRIANGLFIRGDLRYAHREALVNQSSFSWNKKTDREYFSNNPLDFGYPAFTDLPSFAAHQSFEFNFYMRIRLGEKYITYPNRRFHTESKYPEFWIQYRKGIPFLGSDTNFDYLGLTIQKDGWSLGTVGVLSARAKIAGFLNTKSIPFLDYSHFTGNQTVLAKSGQNWRTYQLLPYYAYSTNQWFVEGHVEHDFNGFIWNKIPLLKHLGFEVVAGYHYLYTADHGSYMEATIGLDRLGWKLLRFARVDLVTSYIPNKGIKMGGVFALNFSL